jgi:hypothetical protein
VHERTTGPTCAGTGRLLGTLVVIPTGGEIVSVLAGLLLALIA